MIIRDIYTESIKNNHYSLVLIIEFLVYEKKVLKLTDTKENLTYYFQARFKKKLNEYLSHYETKIKEDLHHERSANN